MVRLPETRVQLRVPPPTRSGPTRRRRPGRGRDPRAPLSGQRTDPEASYGPRVRADGTGRPDGDGESPTPAGTDPIARIRAADQMECPSPPRRAASARTPHTVCLAPRLRRG